jgi:16S rRNA A1518/A1519 N6-dimethyltransferase RsmA/KsgA/DIM1 with predicted DNA glycosylase/AP lyase activity
MKAIHSLGTPMTDEQYCSHWGNESIKHNRQSDYDWMASFIPDNSLVLEIGCGNGLGCIPMLKKGCSIIAIEANEHLAQDAIKNIKNAGFSTKSIVLSNNSHNEIEHQINFHLLQGSLFSVDAENIAKSFEFDFVTNWLFGASPYRAATELNQDISELDSSYAQTYRENATLICYQLARLSKNNNCKLHYTLRSAYEKNTQKQVAINLFAEEQNESIFNQKIVSPQNVTLRKNNALGMISTSQMKYISTAPGVSIPENIKPVIVSVIV